MKHAGKRTRIFFFAEKQENYMCRQIMHCMAGMKVRRKIMQVSVVWENANRLDIATIVEMGEEGYAFCLEDGKIGSVMVTIGPLF